MGLVQVVAPAIEPVTVAELTSFLRIDGTNAEPAPFFLLAALAGAGAGNVDNGVHSYRVTFVTADGETDGGQISAPVTVADKTVNGQIAITAIPTGGSLVTARKIYRTQAAGSTYLLLTTLANNTATTYTDNTADAGLGAGCPTSNTTQDPLLKSLLSAARWEAEKGTKRAFITQTWNFILDQFPHQWPSKIELPLPPLQSVVSIIYQDVNGTLTTHPTSEYVVRTDNLFGYCHPAYGKIWPIPRAIPGAVIVQQQVGYGDTAASVPEGIKTAIKQIAGLLYDNRGLTAALLTAILGPYRAPRMAMV
jgi:uncharacterized phiE125 gp8 family phage protein